MRAVSFLADVLLILMLFIYFCCGEVQGNMVLLLFVFGFW